MLLRDIHIRDPFIFLEDGKYYLYGTRGSECWGKCSGLDVYVSEDLENWSEPIEIFSKPDGFWADRDYWAPEMHKYQGSYYLLVSFKSDDHCRGTQILKSDSPMGPFMLHSDGPVTPENWECLDGTLYVENGKPYMIFCHEWTQVGDGEICAIELSQDLSKSVSEPVLLFRASDSACVKSLTDKNAYVTDGPFLYQTQAGKLIMLWSSFSEEGYCEILSYAKEGTVTGAWEHDDRMLFQKDGGHGMVMRDSRNRLWYIAHTPNQTPYERPVLMEIEERDNSLFVK